MANTGKDSPHSSDEGRRRAAERDTRRAEALRANLRKRKAQQRGRAEADTPPQDSD